MKKGERMSMKQRKIISISRLGKFKGKNNPNWKGGIAIVKYPAEYFQRRDIIKERDNFTCQKCLVTTKQLDVHHIDYNKKNNNIFNLITLCHTCNNNCNSNRKYQEWQWKVFMNIFHDANLKIKW